MCSGVQLPAVPLHWRGIMHRPDPDCIDCQGSGIVHWEDPDGTEGQNPCDCGCDGTHSVVSLRAQLPIEDLIPQFTWIGEG